VGTIQADGVAGRGFIAIAAVIFGGWTLKGTLAGAAVFGIADAMRLALPVLGYALNPQLLGEHAVRDGARHHAVLRPPHPAARVRWRSRSCAASRDRPRTARRTPSRRNSMKAAVYDRHGGPEVLEHREVPDPSPDRATWWCRWRSRR
jgi:hypothetical protein